MQQEVAQTYKYTDTDGHTKLSYSVNMWQSLLVFLSIPRHLWDKAGESALPSGRLFVVGPGVGFHSTCCWNLTFTIQYQSMVDTDSMVNVAGSGMGPRLPNYVFLGSFAACHMLMYFRHPSASVRKERCLLRRARDLLSAAGSWWLEWNSYILPGVGFLCKWAVVSHQLSTKRLRPNVNDNEGFLQWSFSKLFFFFLKYTFNEIIIKGFCDESSSKTLSYYHLLSKKKTRLPWGHSFRSKQSIALLFMVKNKKQKRKTNIFKKNTQNMHLISRAT